MQVWIVSWVGTNKVVKKGYQTEEDAQKMVDVLKDYGILARIEKIETE